jgi:hypothetical protein
LVFSQDSIDTLPILAHGDFAFLNFEFHLSSLVFKLLFLGFQFYLVILITLTVVRTQMAHGAEAGCPLLRPQKGIDSLLLGHTSLFSLGNEQRHIVDFNHALACTFYLFEKIL